MEYFCYLLAVIGVFYALGRGFTILLLPESLRRYTLIVAPWTGYCYVALACWPVFYDEGQIDRHIAEVILIAPVLCLAIELFRKRRVKLVRAIVHVPTLGALAVAAGGFLVLSIPVFWDAGRLTILSLGNNDIVHYAAISRFLSEFTRYDVRYDSLSRARTRSQVSPASTRRETAGQVSIRYWKGSDHSKRVSRGRSKTIFAWG